MPITYQETNKVEITTAHLNFQIGDVIFISKLRIIVVWLGILLFTSRSTNDKRPFNCIYYGFNDTVQLMHPTSHKTLYDPCTHPHTHNTLQTILSPHTTLYDPPSHTILLDFLFFTRAFRPVSEMYSMIEVLYRLLAQWGFDP